jgi:hypothetical protein
MPDFAAGTVSHRMAAVLAIAAAKSLL